MNLNEFIENKEVEYTRNLIVFDDIKDIEKELGVSVGEELAQYILKYGYLGYKHVELYGINSKQKFESDMVTQTKYLHKYFSKTEGFIALENAGDGYYILVGPNDDVYEYSSEDDSIQKTDKKLYAYILKRFQDIDE